MLKPRGALILEDIVYSFAPSEAAAAIERWLESAPVDPGRGWIADELAEHVRGEYSTFSWLLEPILERVGFDVIDHWYSENQVYAAYTCRRR